MYGHMFGERGEENVDLLLGLADSLVSEGKVTQAIDVYSRAYRIGSVSPERLGSLVEAMVEVARERASDTWNSSLPRHDIFLCSLCQSMYVDPVTIPCGHTYCKRCLAKDCYPKTCKKCGVSHAQSQLTPLKSNVLITTVLDKWKNNEMKAAKLRLEGCELFQRGEAIAALEKYREAFDLGLADSLVSEGKVTQAIDVYSRAYRIGSVSPERLGSLVEAMVEVARERASDTWNSSLPRHDIFLCSLCQSMYVDPVTIPCGHTYCKRCLAKDCYPKTCKKCGVSHAQSQLTPLKSNVLITTVLDKWKNNEMKAAKLRLEGCELFQRGEAIAALEKYREAFDLDLGYFCKATALVTLERFEDAAEAFFICLVLDSSSSAVKEELVQIEMIRNLSSYKIISSMTQPIWNNDHHQIICRHDISMNGYFCKATALVTLERFEDAAEAFFICLVLDSSSSAVKEELVQLLHKLLLKNSSSHDYVDLGESSSNNHFFPSLQYQREHSGSEGSLYSSTSNDSYNWQSSDIDSDSSCDEEVLRVISLLIFSAGKDPEHVIPLFLCTVAFPMVPCPLHAFEPRYRLMIRQSMESGTNQFGMCAFMEDSENGIASHGTMLEIREVQYFPDGRAVVDTIGSKRFRVLHTGMRDGYHTGAVEFLSDVPPEDYERDEISQLHDEVHRKAEMWFIGLPSDIKRRVLEHFGQMPSVEEDYLNSQNGPSWFWWMLAILPLDPKAQIAVLAMTSLRRRLEVLHRVLLYLQTHSPL
ncbi:LON peptidase N-terminal domain and RING finger protein 3-like [Centruroides sculpturatus]|uniref:LON peptidase N-terminal domain and RING finger protein 3-like n=1 Tax=Centruroides sculpturatus TaxID=218467 RepID=UPI000C6D8D7A|nr:LON peptidase N-terminal domain and RING finger protein 3-like [Centruroides sculpturatus]